MRLKKGDIFYFNAIDDKISIGQIIDKKSVNIYIIVYKTLFDSIDNYNYDWIKEDDIIISTTTLPSLFTHKRWHVIENKPIDNRVKLPNFKIEKLDGVYITDFEGNVLRRTTSNEETFYFFKNTYSPASIVSGIKVFFGKEEQDEYYTKMFYSYVKKRSDETDGNG